MPIQAELTGSTDGFRGRGALVIAVPGQELLVWSWLTAFDPLVCILADGPGRASTVRNLIEAEAYIGSVFCRTTREGVERALFGRDRARFVAIAEELAEEFVRYGIDYVVRSVAGESVSSRVCRLLVDAATGLAARAAPGIRSWEVAPSTANSRDVTLTADGELWERKRGAIQKHSSWPVELHDCIRETGLDGNRLERFVPVRPFSSEVVSDRTRAASVLRLHRGGAPEIDAALADLSETLRYLVAGGSNRKAAA